MDKNMVNRIWTYYSAMRGMAHSSNMVSAAFIAKKYLDEYGYNVSEIGQEAAYETMLALADRQGVNNPFENPESFDRALRAAQEGIDLEAIISLEDQRERFAIPNVLIKNFESRITESTKQILLPEAEKFVPHLRNLIDSHKECFFTLTTMTDIHKAVLDDMFKDYGNVKVMQTSIYQYEFTSEKFDLILCVPIFAVRDKSEDSEFISREYDLIAVENLLLHLSTDGELAIVVPARITFAGGHVKDLRDFVQSVYCLKEIAELPVGVFENTGLKTYLFTITTGRTEDVTIKRFEAPSKKKRGEEFTELVPAEETFAMVEELDELGDWNIDKIFAMQDEDYLNYQESGVKKEKLGDVAEIFRGKAISKKDPTGNIAVVNISNMGDYKVMYDDLEHIDEEPRKVTNYVLKSGDILIPARGTSVRTAIFEEQSYTCIASSNVIVIRPDQNKLLTAYLKMFLDSPMGIKLLTAMQQGATIISISYKDLKEMEVPAPSIEEQKKLADEYEEELERYHESIKAAEERWQEVVERLQKNF